MSIKLEHVNFDTHPISTRTADMKCFLAPLERQFNITHFSYERLYPNKQIMLLTTHPDVSAMFIREKFYEFAYCGDYEEYQSGYYLADALPLNDLYRLEKENFNLSHGLIIVNKYQDYCEMCYFNTTNSNFAINNFYINHTDILEKFVLDFKRRYQNEIAHADLNKIHYPAHSQDLFLLNHSTQSNRIQDNRTRTSLTDRERECLIQLKGGLSAKQIARELNISHRTVEKHLDNVRMKYGCSSRLELISQT